MSGVTADNPYRASGVIAAAAAGTSWQDVTTGATLTAVAGNGYPINTTSNACTVSLPAGVVGATIEFVDYAGTWDSNAVTLDPNGSENINGQSASATVGYDRQGIKIVYVDATQGWVGVTGINETNPAITIPVYMAATGPDGAAGVTAGDYKVHTFTATKTGSDAFAVTTLGSGGGSTTAEYIVVAGGGGGSGQAGGGGGGGYRSSMVGESTGGGGDIETVMGSFFCSKL